MRLPFRRPPSSDDEAPDLRQGVVRDEHFIERVPAAIEQDDELLMTLLSNYHASHASNSHSDTANISYLSQRPPTVGAPRRNWYRALVTARRALDR